MSFFFPFEIQIAQNVFGGCYISESILDHFEMHPFGHCKQPKWTYLDNCLNAFRVHLLSSSLCHFILICKLTIFLILPILKTKVQLVVNIISIIWLKKNYHKNYTNKSKTITNAMGLFKIQMNHPNMHTWMHFKILWSGFWSNINLDACI